MIQAIIMIVCGLVIAFCGVWRLAKLPQTRDKFFNSNILQRLRSHDLHNNESGTLTPIKGERWEIIDNTNGVIGEKEEI